MDPWLLDMGADSIVRLPAKTKAREGDLVARRARGRRARQRGATVQGMLLLAVVPPSSSTATAAVRRNKAAYEIAEDGLLCLRERVRTKTSKRRRRSARSFLPDAYRGAELMNRNGVPLSPRSSGLPHRLAAWRRRGGRGSARPHRVVEMVLALPCESQTTAVFESLHGQRGRGGRRRDRKGV